MIPQSSQQHGLNSKASYRSIEARGPMLDRVYSMRYKSYSNEEYIDKNDSMKFMDQYDAMPNCKSFLTYQGDNAIGSIRSCIYDPQENLPIPVMEVFDDELREATGYNDIMIEANKFVVDPTFQKSGGVRARFNVYKNIVDTIIDNNAKYLVACIRTEHIKFYKMLHFNPASEIKSYPHLKFKTLLVICDDIPACCDKVYSQTTRRKEVDYGALSSSRNY